MVFIYFCMNGIFDIYFALYIRSRIVYSSSLCIGFLNFDHLVYCACLVTIYSTKTEGYSTKTEGQVKLAYADDFTIINANHKLWVLIGN